MTALKFFAIAANGTPMGIFKGVDEDAAVLAYAHDAGFRDIEDAATRYLDRDVAVDLDDAIDSWRAELEVEVVEPFAVKSVEWLHEESYTMIIARFSVDGRDQIASEYYDLDEDEICTSADAHIHVCGIVDAESGAVIWPSDEVQKKILNAMRDFVEVERPIAA